MISLLILTPGSNCPMEIERIEKAVAEVEKSQTKDEVKILEIDLISIPDSQLIGVMMRVQAAYYELLRFSKVLEETLQMSALEYRIHKVIRPGT